MASTVAVESSCLDYQAPSPEGSLGKTRDTQSTSNQAPVSPATEDLIWRLGSVPTYIQVPSSGAFCGGPVPGCAFCPSLLWARSCDKSFGEYKRGERHGKLSSKSLNSKEERAMTISCC